MATTTMTVVNNLLKEIYEPRVRDQLESEVKAMRRIEKTSEGVTHEVGGKYVTFTVRTGRNHGIGARLENELLPAARSQSYENARVQLAYLYGALELTGQVFELAESNAQAFASALDQEVNGLKQGLAKDVNRQFFGTSIGKIGTANAAGTATTFVCSNAEAIYFEIGMILDLYDNADALKASGTGKVVTNVQPDTPGAGSTTVTFTAAAGAATASGDYFTRTGSRAREMVGIRDIVSTTSILFNINPATVPLWKAVVDNPGVQALSEGRMTTLADSVNTNGGKVTVGFCSLGVRRAYANLLQQQRQVVNTTKFTGGFSGLGFVTDSEEIPIVSDVDCPWNSLYFLNEDEIKLYEAGDWSFMNRDGSNWQRVVGTSGGSVGNFDAYQATLFKYCQLGTHRRNSQASMLQIVEG